MTLMDEGRAAELLQGLVAIPSLSRQEHAASEWLVAQMRELGFARAEVDAAGNAVGELGPVDAEKVIVLLGHIDTVPGDIPVRVEQTDAGALLYGRGSVDAKGPLATFVAACSRLGNAWAQEQNVRVVVVGAVEEEAATSKGARAIRDRFDGVNAPVPVVCIIGEPSSWTRVTLGYKGRLLVEVSATQPMAHTAGPDRGVATVAVDFWNWLAAQADDFNVDQSRAFDQLMPSLRRLHTNTTDAMQDVAKAQIGLRLPPDYDADGLAAAMVAWINARTGGDAALDGPLPDAEPLTLISSGSDLTMSVTFRGYEKTWRSQRDPLLVRSFLGAIRSVVPGVKPGFVVKTGTSDMNVVAPVWQCPIVAYGPGDSSLDHTPNEHIALDEYWGAVRVLEQTLRNVASMLNA